MTIALLNLVLKLTCQLALLLPSLLGALDDVAELVEEPVAGLLPLVGVERAEELVLVSGIETVADVGQALGEGPLEHVFGEDLGLAARYGVKVLGLEFVPCLFVESWEIVVLGFGLRLFRFRPWLWGRGLGDRLAVEYGLHLGFDGGRTGDRRGWLPVVGQGLLVALWGFWASNTI
jgi:hypothetical protein